MIIGHLPAGFITSTLLHSRIGARVSRRAFLWAGMIGSVAPDFDMLWFHLVDHRRHNHHTYLSHWPIVWAGLIALALLWFVCRRHARDGGMAALTLIFTLCGFLHLVLDSVAGGVWWFAPWVSKSYGLFKVPAIYRPWWLNFMLHWSFALEIAIVICALWLYRRMYRPGLVSHAMPTAGRQVE